MDTQVKTPQIVFLQPQRLVVPLFQRPYVWSEDNQWAPLWRDVIRVADRRLAAPGTAQQPHFLGAVVFQHIPNNVGSLQTRSVIDGQQRLTTLQVMLDALHAEFVAVGAEQPALRIEALVVNPPAFCAKPEDRFKVWPTNKDRKPFNAVMSAEIPVDYQTLEDPKARLVQAHRYFAEQARAWMALNGPDEVHVRAETLDYTVRELLQLVVIELTFEENAQEIFETLNARGAQLTAADLIKNFVFQRLMEQGVDVETAYETRWKQFETGFWETEMSFGRLHYSRSSVFLNHLLIARTGEEIVAREVFTSFKAYTVDSNLPMAELLEQVSRAAAVYKDFVDGATANNPIDRIQLFAYRSSILESEVFKPVALWLLDPEQEPVPGEQLVKALDVLESWLVRRMLVRATTKAYNKVAAELVAHLTKGNRDLTGDEVESFLAEQDAASRYWPDDAEVTAELVELQAYKRLRRGRLRMVLEAVEDHERGWKDGKEGMGGERVPRGKFHIEHVMPQRWEDHWPLGNGTSDERDRLVHTLGNLTLLTAPLNGTVSNSPWATKKGHVAHHDVLKMNGKLLHLAGDTWDEAIVRQRTAELTSAILQIWPVPQGHTSTFGTTEKSPTSKVWLSDLIGAGLLQPGTVLHARTTTEDRVATVLADGSLDVDGSSYDTPSGAARAIVGYAINGWPFFRLEPGGTRSLTTLFEEYVDLTSADVDDEGIEDLDNGFDQLVER